MPIHPVEDKKPITVKQHIPAFISGFSASVFQPESVDKILELDFLKQWEKDTAFQKWSVSNYLEDTVILVAMLTDGKFFVAAYIDGITEEESLTLGSRFVHPTIKEEKKNEPNIWRPKYIGYEG